MYILHKTRERSGGYARTFLRELEEVLPACVERGITVVSNAGGLDPEGLAAAVRRAGARARALEVRVASVSGDDITPQLARAPGRRASASSTSTPASRCRRTRPSSRPTPTCGPARSPTRWPPARRWSSRAGSPTPPSWSGRRCTPSGGPTRDLDAIAGAVVAGHVIECGAQCCGGNYAFFEEVPGRERIGFPIAELHADGSSVITKHPGTGRRGDGGHGDGAAALRDRRPALPEPRRGGPLRHHRAGPGRARTGCASRACAGEPPPPTLKVTANLDAGWRNSMTLALTGRQVAEKARFAADAVWAGIPGGRAAFAETAEDLSGDLTGGGMAYLRLAVRGDDEQAVGRAFSGAVVETSLSSYPGHLLHRRALGRAGRGPLLADDGRRRGGHAAHRVRRARRCRHAAADRRRAGRRAATRRPAPSPTRRGRPTSRRQRRGDLVRVPLWVLVGARSGDKGGDANVGLWADEEAVAALAPTGLHHRALHGAPARGRSRSRSSRYPLPNLRAVNFVVHGILGWGVASNLRLDTQAKGLGELLRSRHVEVPASLVAAGGRRRGCA